VPGALAGLMNEDVERTMADLDSAAAEYGLEPVSKMLAAPDAPTLGELMMEAPERIDPAIYATSLCLAMLLERDRGIVPDVVSGHRLGEVAALAVAGVLTPADGMRVVCENAATTPNRSAASIWDIPLGRPRIRCRSPRTGRYVTSEDGIARLLYEKGLTPVGFVTTARALYVDGVTRFVECGARALLTVLTLDCLPHVTALTAVQVVRGGAERHRAGRVQAVDW